jgi:ATP-dependent RNA helicase DDX19/DBP5
MDTKWEDLGISKAVLDGIADKGWTRPSKIQAQSLPHILGTGSTPPEKLVNVLAQARAGSGKTGCFAVACLAQVDTAVQQPQAICVCPTRILAAQVAKEVETLGKHTGVKVELQTGDVPVTKTPIKAQVVVGTLHRIRNCITKRVLKLDKMKVFVVDEADEIINECGSDLKQTFKQRFARAKVDPQVLLFSASFDQTGAINPVEFANKELLTSPVRSHVDIIVESKDLLSERVKFFFMSVPKPADKVTVVTDLYSTASLLKTIIFANTKAMVRRLKADLTAASVSVNVVDGDVKAEDRDRYLQELKDGKVNVVIATDVAARGIDVNGLSLVINFDIPTKHGNKGQADVVHYQHRVGRTGRMGRLGVVLDLCSSPDDVNAYKAITSHFSFQPERLNPADLDDSGEKIEDFIQGKAGSKDAAAATAGGGGGGSA